MVSWLDRVAKDGRAPIEFEIGIIYLNGYGVPRDENAAWRWIEKSALLGSCRGAAAMGERAAKDSEHWHGKAEACEWFDVAAALGDPFASNSYAECARRLTRSELEVARSRADATLRLIRANLGVPWMVATFPRPSAEVSATRGVSGH